MIETTARNNCHRRRIHISDELLLSVLVAGDHKYGSYHVIEHAIPDDAKIIDVQHVGDVVEFLVESAEYSIVHVGNKIPIVYAPTVEAIPPADIPKLD